jgi:hypothetical protein
MYYPGYNYNAPEQAAAKGYDQAVSNWTDYVSHVNNGIGGLGTGMQRTGGAVHDDFYY